LPGSPWCERRHIYKMLKCWRLFLLTGTSGIPWRIVENKLSGMSGVFPLTTYKCYFFHCFLKIVIQFSQLLFYNNQFIWQRKAKNITHFIYKDNKIETSFIYFHFWTFMLNSPLHSFSSSEDSLTYILIPGVRNSAKLLYSLGSKYSR
jgi:hypothetical protein